jgi:hypothetical protein
MLKPPLPVIAALIAAMPAYATDYTDTARVVSATLPIRYKLLFLLIKNEYS